MTCNTATGKKTPLEGAVAGGVTLVTLTVAFGLLALGWPLFWVAFPVGFGAGMPLAVGLARAYGSQSSGRSRGSGGWSGGQSDGGDDGDDALAALRERYARGEIDEREFERRVEHLLETKSGHGSNRPADRGPGVPGRN